MQRRAFLTTLAAATLTGCTDTPPAHRYNNDDIDLLANQRAEEVARNGQSPFGVHRYQGYQGLAKLPWFELDQSKELRCIDESIPNIIDMHCHLGMSVLFEPELDLSQSHDRTQHLLDCDGQPACDLDLDVYANGNFTEQTLKTLESQVRAQGLWGSSFARTQTIPNLIREMDAMRVEQAVLLPIKLGLWFGDNLTEQWHTAVDNTKQQDRLITGFSVHPRADNKLEQLQNYAEQGFKIMKLHPTVQRFYPDDDSMMELYELAQNLGIIIFFHGGRAGIEPESSHPFAMPRHYEKAIRDFPNMQFILGHGGARDFDAMLALALKYKNAWFGTHGQSLTNLDTAIKATGGERLLFGTDWPFYHIGMSLAKVLIATDDPARISIRNRLLQTNAQQLLAS